MNEKVKATFFVQCMGCKKVVEKEVDNWCVFDFRIEQLISQEGWIKRSFGPNANPWFCSPFCAYQSAAAIQCEAWWKDNPPPHWFRSLLQKCRVKFMSIWDK